MQPFAKIASRRRHPSQPTTPNPPTAKLLQALDSFIIIVREGLIIACAALFHSLEKKCEVAGVAVSPECRGQGQGDKLLD
ncbi:probable amino-acid acetyltransferase NAGS1, chloroplastic isoform X2 [Rhododendron vialii]|uniref:probable amino-acid acetyltransferase NAGS1, chloroplastic isoform X2 n=1 Tax=Rhododendron vialii TaxID=182163 RepID=UPI0026603BAD|nr:probable amino-acid acetyltransferase NAGS1, chloroplastic isoform X2 [Rhododendron vialii]